MCFRTIPQVDVEGVKIYFHHSHHNLHSGFYEYFCGSVMFFLSCRLFAMPLCASFICALWSPAGKGLTSWLWFVVSNCEFVTFPLVSWVRCGT